MTLCGVPVGASELRAYCTVLWVAKSLVIGYVLVSLSTKGGLAGVSVNQRVSDCERFSIEREWDRRCATTVYGSADACTQFTPAQCTPATWNTPGDRVGNRCIWRDSCPPGMQVIIILILALFWLAYSRLLLPMTERLEQVLTNFM